MTIAAIKNRGVLWNIGFSSPKRRMPTTVALTLFPPLTLCHLFKGGVVRQRELYTFYLQLLIDALFWV